LPETLAKLARAAAGAKAGISISYFVSSAASSGSPDCAYPALISTARRHAENLAAAAGLHVGKVTNLSDGSGQSEAVPIAAVFVPVLRLLTDGTLYTPPVVPTACPTVVQFQLLR